MGNENVHQFFCGGSNFGVLVKDPDSDSTVAIDVPASKPVEDAISETGWNLSDILITHHHLDHIEGLPQIKKKFGANVYGPAKSAEKIGHIDHKLSDRDSFKIGNLDVRVIATPGHTLDMLCFHFPQLRIAFTGDTLFALGCGKVFEGDAGMMWSSLSRLINDLPADTVIYCGHDLTLSNAKFALTVDPDNSQLAKRYEEVQRLTKDGLPTLPTTMELELATNPFLRTQDQSIMNNIGLNGASPEEVFAELRSRKDNF